jgi:hypothetical protein
MKEHFCPIEKEWLGFEVQCNWCGEKELIAKKPWVGLSDDEAFELVSQDYQMEEYANAAVQLIQRAEAKLREKNT